MLSLKSRLLILLELPKPDSSESLKLTITVQKVPSK